MKVFLDTDVLVAAFVSRGQCDELLEHCVRNHDVVTSGRVLDELERVLGEKIEFPRSTVGEALRLVRGEASEVEASDLPEPVSRDPDDDRVLAAATEADCDCVVTGDGDLLTLESCEGIPILRPSSFWEHDLDLSTRDDDAD